MLFDPDGPDVIADHVFGCNAICEAAEDRQIIFTAHNRIHITTNRARDVSLGFIFRASSEIITDAHIIGCTGLAMLPGNITIVTDSINKVIYSISKDGETTILAGQFGVEGHKDGPALEARFTRLTGLAIWKDGTILVTDDNCIRSISSHRVVKTHCSGMFPQNCKLASIAVCPDESVLVISTHLRHYTSEILKVDIVEGTVTHIAGFHNEITESLDGIGKAACFDHAYSICCQKDSKNVIVGSRLNGTISHINLETREVLHFHTDNDDMVAVCVTRDGSLCIAQNPVIWLSPGPIKQNGEFQLKTMYDHHPDPNRSRRAMSTMLAEKRFIPSRMSSLPPWAREAIQTVFTMVAASKKVGRGGVVGLLPVLPEEIWLIILGLVPHNMLGKPHASIPGPWQPFIDGELGRPLILKAFDERIAAFELQLAELKAARAREQPGRDTEHTQPRVNMRSTMSIQEQQERTPAGKKTQNP